MKLTRILLLISLFAFLFLTSAYSDVSIRSWQMSTKNGLTNNSVRRLHQDAYGFVWIGTFNGLHRFDGNNIVLYQPTPKDSITLSDHRIDKIEEDGKGYLWIGTSNERISCFDIRQERFVDFTGNGTFNTAYNHIFVDSRKDVWLWNSWQNGCLHVHEEEGRFTSQKYDIKNGNLHNDRVTSLKEDQNGNIWISTRKGITLVQNGKSRLIKGQYNPVKIFFHKNQVYIVTRDGVIARYSPKEDAMVEVARVDPPNNKYISTALQRENECWIFTNNQTLIFDFDTQRIRISTEITIPFALTFTDNGGNYWVFNGTGNVWFFPKYAKQSVKLFAFMSPETLKLIDRERYYVWQDSRGLFWITTYGNGLFVYNPVTNELDHFAAYQTNNVIDSDFLYYLMEDSNGDIWVGSEYGGLYHLSVMGNGFSKIKTDKVSPGFFTGQINEISPAGEGKYWVSNGNGELLLYNQTFEECIRKETYPANIHAIRYDSKGSMIVGSNGNGIRIGNRWYKEQNTDAALTKVGYIGFLPQTNASVHVSDSPSSNYINTLYTDDKDRIWGGTWGKGLILIDEKNNQPVFQSFLYKEDINARQIHAICEDRMGWMWVGTMSGLYKFHPDSLIANPEKFYFFTKKNSSLWDDDIVAIYEDYAGNVWLGTSGSGVSVHVPSNDSQQLNLTHYNTADGLSSNEISAFIEDDKNKLWISTKNGLTCYTPETKTFDKFYLSSTPKGDMYTSAACRGENGQLLFGTNDGIISVYPDEILKKHTANKPLFTSLFVNGILVNTNSPDAILSRGITYYDQIKLAYDQNTFTLQFSNCEFFEPGKSYYSYKLENYDDTWSEPSDVNQASYKNLLPGNYTFRVRACNSVGVWSEEEGVLSLTITPPFWKTPWAYLIYTLLSLAFIYLVYRIIHKFIALRQHVQIERKLTEFKLQFFTNIAHEFRTPLTLIHGGIEKLELIGDLPDKAVQSVNSIRNNSRRLMQLIEQLLMFRKIQKNKLGLALEETDVIAFIKEIFLTFYDSAVSKDIIYRFLPFENNYTMYVDKGFLDKIMYNLLSNAFKFTPNGGSINLHVSADKENEKLIIQVKDSGIGIPKEKQDQLFTRFAQINPASKSFGIGLHLTHELILAHHGSIEYAENEERGSIFTVRLPLSEKVYPKEDFVTVASVVTDNSKQASYMNNAIMKHSTSVPLNNIKLLIIDDDEEIREYIQGVMKNYFLTTTASDGQEGLEMVEKFCPDIILCDVLMPNMTGYEFTRQLRKDKRTSHIPVILLTSLSEEEDKLKGYESGADAYITKPFSIRLLLARIINIMEQRSELKEKFSKDDMNPTKLILFSNDQDKKFLDRMNTIIDHNLADQEFDVDAFAMAMGYKRTVFYQKVNAITGKTPNEYLRDARLKKAAELLLDDRLNVAEVAYQIGFTDPSYFSKCFKTYYGVTPSCFQNRKSD